MAIYQSLRMGHNTIKIRTNRMNYVRGLVTIDSNLPKRKFLLFFRRLRNFSSSHFGELKNWVFAHNGLKLNKDHTNFSRSIFVKQVKSLYTLNQYNRQFMKSTAGDESITNQQLKIVPLFFKSSKNSLSIRSHGK